MISAVSVESNNMSLAALESRLGYHFKQQTLLEQALTHRSHNARHNERLEFLGDSVLNVVIAAILYDRFDAIDEGDLSRLRANLVKQASLAEIGQKLGLATYLRLGEGEMKSGGFRRPSILADTLEALFGAVFIDGGFEEARKVVANQYQPVLDSMNPETLGKDAKTLLQEVLQGRKLALPVYTVVATHGAAHSQQFEVECAVPIMQISVTASGASRRAAEQSAAKLVLAAIEAAPTPKPARKSSRARKTTQLTLPVAVVQENK